jgi:DNA-binding NtrC family response regulator
MFGALISFDLVKSMGSTKFRTVPLSEVFAKGMAPDTTPFRPIALVVDDERVIADTLVAILNKFGFAATAAYDGQSAYEQAMLVPPAVVISDVVMQGMSGIELAIALKGALPECRTILFSGQAATVDLLADARMCGHDFTVLTKPLHPHDLLDHVSQFTIGANEPGSTSGKNELGAYAG